MKRRFLGRMIAIGMFAVLSVSSVYASGTGVTEGAEQTQDPVSVGELSRHKMKTSQLDSFEYWLYTPPNAVDNMPLMVHLHGGKNNFTEHKDSLYTLLKNKELEIPAYIVFPVKAEKIGRWKDIGNSVIELANSVAETYKTDKNKISLYGYSAGAVDAIAIASGHPEVFSCVVATSPGHAIKQEQIEPLKNMAVGYVAGLQEVPTMKRDCEASVRSINNAGGNATLFLVAGADHPIVTQELFLKPEYGFVEWMLAASKPSE